MVVVLGVVTVVEKLVVDNLSMSEEIITGVSSLRLGRMEGPILTVVYVSILEKEVLLEEDIVFQIKRDIFRAVSFSVLGGMLELIV